MGATGGEIKLQPTRYDMSEEEAHIENEGTTYSFEKVVSITGVNRTTIIEYCETGLLPFAAEQAEQAEFNDELINLIRRVETLKTVHGINDTGIHMILDLMDEVEKLRQELKFRVDG